MQVAAQASKGPLSAEIYKAVPVLTTKPPAAAAGRPMYQATPYQAAHARELCGQRGLDCVALAQVGASGVELRLGSPQLSSTSAALCGGSGQLGGASSFGGGARAELRSAGCQSDGRGCRSCCSGKPTAGVRVTVTGCCRRCKAVRRAGRWATGEWPSSIVMPGTSSAFNLPRGSWTQASRHSSAATAMAGDCCMTLCRGVPAVLQVDGRWAIGKGWASTSARIG